VNSDDKFQVKKEDIKDDRSSIGKWRERPSCVEREGSEQNIEFH
jgi:hypothetical protein